MGRKRKSETMVIDTDHHIVEIEKSAFQEMENFCNLNRITLDYFFFEFMEFEG